MGKYITSFGLDIDEINSAFGCKDNKLLASIKKARTFFDYDEMTGVSSAFSVFDAIDDFLFAKMHDVPDAVYCCAVLLLCDAFRIPLPFEQRLQFGEQIDLMNTYLVKNFAMPKTIRIERLVFNSDCANAFKKKLVMPKTFARFSDDDNLDYLNLPMLALWSHSRVREAQKIFARVAITEKDIQTILKGKTLGYKLKGAVYRNIMDFLHNVDYCAAHKLGMMHVSY